MNRKQLEDWLKEINAKLARIQQPYGKYFANEAAWKRFGRDVDPYDGRPIQLLALEHWGTAEIELRSELLYEVYFTSADPSQPEFDDHGAIIAHASACGLTIYYSEDGITIFCLPE